MTEQKNTKTTPEPKQPEPKIPFDLSADEANGLLEVLDIACKAAGMRIAPLCVHLSGRIQAAATKHNTQASKDSK